MTILKHKIWPKLEPYVHIEFAKKGDSASPRVRIELHALPLTLKARALKATMKCVACGDVIHPIRARRAPSKRSQSGGLYYAPSCPLDVKIGCSRGDAVSDEYTNVRKYFNL